MTRYNIFYQVHKGLRELLYNTASLLQQTDFNNENESAAVLSQVDTVLDLFDKHADTEDHFILPAIEKHAPSVATMFEEDHVLDHELSGKLRSLLSIFRHTHNESEKEIAGGAVRLAFTEFLTFNLQHMGKEESRLNALLWEYYTDGALHAITQQILAHQQPEAMAEFSRWMMRGLSNNEIKKWLQEVKNNAPGFVFGNLLLLAEQELPAYRWESIQACITEGAQLA